MQFLDQPLPQELQVGTHLWWVLCAVTGAPGSLEQKHCPEVGLKPCGSPLCFVVMVHLGWLPCVCRGWQEGLLASEQWCCLSAGTGMNEDELKRNAVLTDYSVKDLNEDPHLPYDDATFDVRGRLQSLSMQCCAAASVSLLWFDCTQLALAQLLQYCSARAVANLGRPG